MTTSRSDPQKQNGVTFPLHRINENVKHAVVQQKHKRTSERVDVDSRTDAAGRREAQRQDRLSVCVRVCVCVCVCVCVIQEVQLLSKFRSTRGRKFKPTSLTQLLVCVCVRECVCVCVCVSVCVRVDAVIYLCL